MEDSQEFSRCSSFEALNHDPNLSRLAKNMFLKTSDYLQFELSSNLLDYEALDKMNKCASKSVDNMKKVTDDIVVVNDELNQKFTELEPLFKDLEDIESTVIKLESAAFRLDSYVGRLDEKINAHIQKKKST